MLHPHLAVSGRRLSSRVLEPLYDMQTEREWEARLAAVITLAAGALAFMLSV